MLLLSLRSLVEIKGLQIKLKESENWDMEWNILELCFKNTRKHRQASHAASAHLLQLEPVVSRCFQQEPLTEPPALGGSIHMAQGKVGSHRPWRPATHC
jgi:hypothetical protein